MTVASLGFVALHTCDLTPPTAVQGVLAFLRAPSWGVALRHYSSIPDGPMLRRPGVIRAAERDAVFAAMITNRGNYEVSMASESLMRSTDARAELSMSWPGVFERFSTARGLRPTRDESSDQRWTEDVVELLSCLQAHTAVIVAMEHRSALSETTGAGFRSQGVLHHPFPDEFERMRGSNGKHMGTRYMRFPRWGTLVSHDHVAQLGGVAAITAAVQPAVVRSLAGGVYFQLTESVATARGEEAAAKQRAFTAMAAPLLPPADT